VLNSLPSSVHDLARNAGVRDRDRDPLLSRPQRVLDPLLVTPSSVAIWHRYLRSRRPPAVEPPYAVTLVRVEPGGNLGPYQRGDLVEGARLIHVITNDAVADEGRVPPLHAAVSAIRQLDTFSGEPLSYGVQGQTVRDHDEDAPYNGHGLRVYLIAVSGIVVPEAVVDTVIGYNLSLSSLAQLATPRPLRGLRPLVLGELVKDAVSKLTLRTLISSVVEGTYLRAVLLKLTSE
jgi:hypothetical protein